MRPQVLNKLFRPTSALKGVGPRIAKLIARLAGLKVIDVLKNPQLAEEDKILATPTLAKILPPPVRRIIGDLSDRERVLIGLDLLYEELSENKFFSSVSSPFSDEDT